MKPRLSSDERRLVLAVASRLLQYPDAALQDQLPLLRDAAGRLPASVGTPLRRFVDRLGSRPLLELQADYVATFDLRRRHCLYLTYHQDGDTRRRGMALWRFRQLYRERGYALAASELPDFLPAVLELAAEADVDDRGPVDLLVEHHPAITVLRDALAGARSPYVDVVEALRAALPAPSREALEAARRLEEEGPPAEQVGLEPYALEPTAPVPHIGEEDPVPGIPAGGRA